MIIKEEMTGKDKEELLREVEKIVKKELSGKASKKVMKEVIKDALSDLYKTMWLRRSTWLSGI